jgi:hypothetical protein
LTASSERLTAAQYVEALREAVRFRAEPPVGDALAVVLGRIEQNPAFSQSRLLTRLLVALTHREGEFRKAEIAGLDAPTYALAIGLLDAFDAGTSSRDDWVLAVAAARAAEREAQ